MSLRINYVNIWKNKIPGRNVFLYGENRIFIENITDSFDKVRNITIVLIFNIIFVILIK